MFQWPPRDVIRASLRAIAALAVAGAASPAAARSLRPTDSDRLAGVEWRFHAGTPVFAPPAVTADGTIFVGTAEGSVQAVSPEGVLRWSYTLEGAVLWAPLVDSGRVYVATSAQRIYSFTKGGELGWQLRPPSHVATSLALAPWGFVYGGTDGAVWAVSPRAAPLWHVELRQNVSAGPVLVGRRLVVGGVLGDVFFYEGAMRRFVARLGGALRGDPVLFHDGSVAVLAGTTLYGLDSHAKIRWHRDGIGWIAPSDTGLLAVDARGDLVYLAEDGGLSAEVPLETSVSAPPVAAPRGFVLVPSDSGDLLVVDRSGVVRSVPVAHSPLREPVLDNSRGRIVVAAGGGTVAAVRLED
jgi:outer membrane protein assembly factor BamB